MAAHPIAAKDINALSGRDYQQSRMSWGSRDTVRHLTAVLATRFAYWRNYRSTVTELGSLTDRQLADIGVTRGEIPSVARTSASRMTSW